MYQRENFIFIQNRNISKNKTEKYFNCMYYLAEVLPQAYTEGVEFKIVFFPFPK